MVTEVKRYVKGEMSVGEVQEAKLMVVSAKSPKYVFPQ